MEGDQDLEMDFVAFEDEEAEEVPFFIVEEKPRFLGGSEDNFRKWIYDHLHYPEIAAENGISGRVILQFTIDTDGKIKNIRVVRGVDPSLDKEALRVVKSAPKWTPGKQRGKPVKVQYTFPIVYVLQ